MSKEVMKLALEALEMWCPMTATYLNTRDKAITALREALAEQPAQQEPVGWMHWLHGPVRLFLNKDEAQMELERLNREYPVDVGSRKMRPLVFGDTSPPASKPWVGLTDKDITETFDEVPSAQDDPWWLRYARVIEAKLKEKNT